VQGRAEGSCQEACSGRAFYVFLPVRIFFFCVSDRFPTIKAKLGSYSAGRIKKPGHFRRFSAPPMRAQPCFCGQAAGFIAVDELLDGRLGFKLAHGEVVEERKAGSAAPGPRNVR